MYSEKEHRAYLEKKLAHVETRVPRWNRDAWGIEEFIHFKSKGYELVYQIPIIEDGNLMGMHYFFKIDKVPWEVQTSTPTTSEAIDPDTLQFMDECDKEWVEGWRKQVQKSKLSKSEQDYVEMTDKLIWPEKPRIDKMFRGSKPKANEE